MRERGRFIHTSVLVFTFLGGDNRETFVSYTSLSLSSTWKQCLPSSGHSRPCGAPCSRTGPYSATRTARWAVAPCTPPIKELPFGGRQSAIRQRVGRERPEGARPLWTPRPRGASAAPTLDTPSLCRGRTASFASSGNSSNDSGSRLKNDRLPPSRRRPISEPSQSLSGSSTKASYIPQADSAPPGRGAGGVGGRWNDRKTTEKTTTAAHFIRNQPLL